LLHDDQRYDTMRRAALERAKDFSADLIVPQYERAYEEALG
jgi:hypothetical protein